MSTDSRENQMEIVFEMDVIIHFFRIAQGQNKLFSIVFSILHLK